MPSGICALDRLPRLFQSGRPAGQGDDILRHPDKNPNTAGVAALGKVKTFVLNMPVGFGPFTLPAGQIVSLRAAANPSDNRAANVGNKFFAALNLRMLLDYRARQMVFYGDCKDRRRS